LSQGSEPGQAQPTKQDILELPIPLQQRLPSRAVAQPGDGFERQPPNAELQNGDIGQIRVEALRRLAGIRSGKESGNAAAR
jgi:hypothetical protein